MDDHKVNSQLQQQIDACRAADFLDGSDVNGARIAAPGLDLLAGALAAEQNRADDDSPIADALRQSAAFDRSMAAAFRDVQPPEGLASRLLMGVLEDSPAGEEPSADAKIEPAATRPASRRGVLITLGCAFAAAAALMLVALLPAPTLSRDEFMVLVDKQWVDRSLQTEPETWRELEDAPAVANRPSSNMVRVRAAHWRLFSSQLDPAGVEYDLSTRGSGRQAILYVVSTRTVIQGLPTVPARRPQVQTGGWVISSWREGDLVYVLAVQGDAARYRRMIRLPHFG